MIFVDEGNAHWLAAGWRTPCQLWNTLNANRARVTENMLTKMLTGVLSRNSFSKLVHLTFADDNFMQTVYSRQLDYPRNKRYADPRNEWVSPLKEIQRDDTSTAAKARSVYLRGECKVKLPNQLDSSKPTDTLSQDPLSPIFIDLTLD